MPSLSKYDKEEFFLVLPNFRELPVLAPRLRQYKQDYHSNDLRTLIICPKNLVSMWEDYDHKYDLGAKVIPISKIQKELPTLRRYQIVLIDESHSLRNKKARRYKDVFEYIRQNESKCILLSATPYNKTYHDLSNQLRLFIPEDRDIGIRPEIYLKEACAGDINEFYRLHQCSAHSLAAFEKSEFSEDWRELMRLFDGPCRY